MFWDGLRRNNDLMGYAGMMGLGVIYWEWGQLNDSMDSRHLGRMHVALYAPLCIIISFFPSAAENMELGQSEHMGGFFVAFV